MGEGKDVCPVIYHQPDLVVLCPSSAPHSHQTGDHCYALDYGHYYPRIRNNLYGESRHYNPDEVKVVMTVYR